MRSQEEDLKKKQLQQRQHEENLQKREQELDAREIELLGRELNIMITQSAPTPKKRLGKFSKTRLKVTIFVARWKVDRESSIFVFSLFSLVVGHIQSIRL